VLQRGRGESKPRAPGRKRGIGEGEKTAGLSEKPPSGLVKRGLQEGTRPSTSSRKKRRKRGGIKGKEEA